MWNSRQRSEIVPRWFWGTMSMRVSGFEREVIGHNCQAGKVRKSLDLQPSSHESQESSSCFEDTWPPLQHGDRSQRWMATGSWDWAWGIYTNWAETAFMLATIVVNVPLVAWRAQWAHVQFHPYKLINWVAWKGSVLTKSEVRSSVQSPQLPFCLFLFLVRLGNHTSHVN